jgi:hypothetical protein
VLENTALHKITSSIMTKRGFFTKYVTQCSHPVQHTYGITK